MPGSMTPFGTEMKKTNEKANVMEDNISNRKHSHSTAPAILNLGREYASITFIFMSRNLTLDQSSLWLLTQKLFRQNVVSLELCRLQLSATALVLKGCNIAA